MHAVDRDMPELELALMRRSLAGLADTIERCDGCGRTMLVGEVVYEYASGRAACALCRDRERSDLADERRVHGPEFGHTIRVLDQRPRRLAA